MVEESRLTRELAKLESLCGLLHENLTDYEFLGPLGRALKEVATNGRKPEDLLFELIRAASAVQEEGVDLLIGPATLSTLGLDLPFLTTLRRSGLSQVSEVFNMSMAQLSELEQVGEKRLSALIDALVKTTYLPEGVTFTQLREEYLFVPLFEAGYLIRRYRRIQ
jgi:hypothetical protein